MVDQTALMKTKEEGCYQDKYSTPVDDPAACRAPSPPCRLYLVCIEVGCTGCLCMLRCENLNPSSTRKKRTYRKEKEKEANSTASVQDTSHRTKAQACSSGDVEK